MDKNFIAAMFDTTFEHFVVPRILKVIFWIFVGLAGLGTLGFIVMGFSRGAGPGILALLLSPVIFGLYCLAVRIYTELIVVGFRVAELLKRIEENTRGGGMDRPSAGGYGAPAPAPMGHAPAPMAPAPAPAGGGWDNAPAPAPAPPAQGGGGWS